VDNNDTPLRLAYDASVRAIEDQVQVLDDLRSRAATLLAASALVASFLGSRALATADRIEPFSFNGLAVAGFVLIAVLTLVILWPFRLRFNVSAIEMIEVIDSRAANSPITMAETYRELAVQLEEIHLFNAVRMRLLFWLLRVAILALICEVVAWVFVLWSV
jgi:hypothetical protein